MIIGKRGASVEPALPLDIWMVDPHPTVDKGQGQIAGLLSALIAANTKWVLFALSVQEKWVRFLLSVCCSLKVTQVLLLAK